MATVFDVAKAIVSRSGAVTPLKLQKLAYYTQAWTLVRLGKPAFQEPIEAWRYGPVCPELYNAHKQTQLVPYPYPLGDETFLEGAIVEVTEAVLEVYGAQSAAILSALTHREAPWLDARGGLPDDARGNAIIEHEAMRVYYATVDSVERRRVMAFGREANPIVNYMNAMDDDEAAVIDELSLLDLDPEVAKLTA